MVEVTKTFSQCKSFEVIPETVYFVLDLDSCSELLILNLTLAGVCLILGLHLSPTPTQS